MEIADKLAIDEYKKYRVVQDLKYTNTPKRRDWAFFLKLFIVVLFFLINIMISFCSYLINFFSI